MREWCDAARNQFIASLATYKNGDERLEAAKLDELRKLLIGQKVTWRLSVEEVRWPDAIYLNSHLQKPFEDYGNLPVVIVRFNGCRRANTISDVPAHLMQQIKEGDTVELTGKVTGITPMILSGFWLLIDEAVVRPVSK